MLLGMVEGCSGSQTSVFEPSPECPAVLYPFVLLLCRSSSGQHPASTPGSGRTRSSCNPHQFCTMPMGFFAYLYWDFLKYKGKATEKEGKCSKRNKWGDGELCRVCLLSSEVRLYPNSHLPPEDFDEIAFYG